jgi:putative heme-binding domain-containing protein
MNSAVFPKKTFLYFLILTLACTPSKKEDIAKIESEPDIYADHVRTSEFQTPEQERLSFILPPGFEVTLFASEPDITKPINMAFDEKGRLWVTQSSEYPYAAGPNEGRDRITILEDTNRDGQADLIQDFVNDLNIPIGIVPAKNGAIAYSIPNVYRFIDSNGDGKADQREILLGPFEHKDTHGMVNNLFRSWDGWIHASHGFSNISTLSGKDGHEVTMVSGNTFRFKEDGSRIEKTTDGRINPFGSDLDEMGYHYSADCHTMPIYQLIWGGNYTQWGKKTPNMGFAPEMMDYGLNSTALSGLVYYTDNQFPEAYRNSFYSGDVVTCRISRSTVEFNGSTPKATRQKDFLVSKDPWFRPVDIKIGPDGAMYIADFYNRIIGHYEVPLDHPGRDRISGRIWKITYKGNHREKTDWSKANQEELILGMGHEVLQTRMTTTDELVDRFGKKVTPSLLTLANRQETDPLLQIQVLWALFRLESLPSAVLNRNLAHPDFRVRLHAYRILSNLSEISSQQLEQSIKDLEDPNPHVQRAAAEFLSRHPHPKSYSKLVEIYTKVPPDDTHLSYTVLLALYNHLNQTEIIRLVINDSWTEPQEKLLALVMSDLNSQESGEFLYKFVQIYPLNSDKKIAYLESIIRNIPSPQLGNVLNWTKKSASTEPTKAFKFAMASQQGFEQRGMTPDSGYLDWYKSLSVDILSKAEMANLSDLEKQSLTFALEVAGKLQIDQLSPNLVQIVESKDSDQEIRGHAAAALIRIDADRFVGVVANRMVDGNEEIQARRSFANAIGLCHSEICRGKLGEGLKNAPPDLQETIAWVLARNSEGKSELMNLIRQGYAPARILKNRSVEEAMLNNITQVQKNEYEALTANLEPISAEKQRILEMRLAAFDSNPNTLPSGKALFETHCGLCHQIQNQGGEIGPQLDGVGNWGKNALATKILDPNRNISENFRTYNFTLSNGQTISGLYRREEGETIVLANQSGQEFSIAKKEIVEQIPSLYTLMPDNFDTILSQDEFDALMTYLLNVK